jgi:hypothetical protein
MWEGVKAFVTLFVVIFIGLFFLAFLGVDITNINFPSSVEVK